MSRLFAHVIFVNAALISACSGSLPAAAAQRVALVIGNSAYKHTGELVNPRNDAADISVILKRLGFQVLEGLDLDKSGFDRKVRDFAVAMKGAEVGVFFYAGHGLQVGGQNYLVPVDAELSSSAALDFEMIRLDLIHRTMEREAKTNILFLDACRNNPLQRNLKLAMGTRSAEIGRGLAAVESGVGTLISFSTQPGNIAVDGTGRNSPFARALVKHLARPGDDLSAVLIAVRNDVIQETQRQQVPWEHSSLTGRFYFSPLVAGANARTTAADQTPPPQATSSEAGSVWETLKDTQDVADLEAYRQQFGKAHPFHDRLAEKRIAELKKQQVAAVSAPKPRGEPAKPNVTFAVEPSTRIIGRVIFSRPVKLDPSKGEGKTTACGNVCTTTPSCAAFDVSIVYNKCTLFGTVEKRTALPGFVSGVRQTP